MINIAVRTNTQSVKELQKKLRGFPKEFRLAVLNAHRYAVSEIKKLAVEKTAHAYYLTRGQVRKSITASRTGFKVSSGMLSLDKYKLTPKTPSKKYVLKGAVKRSRTIKPLGNNAFLLKTRGGYKPVARLTRKRYPLKVLTGPSIAQAAFQALFGGLKYDDDDDFDFLADNAQGIAEYLFTKKLEEYLAKIGAVK